MAAWSCDLDDQKSGATVQTEGHTLTLPNGQIDPEEMEASGSTPSHSPSQISGEEANAWLPWDSVLFGNSSYLNQRWRNYTTTSTCLAGTHGRRHASRHQIWPHRSGCDRPRSSLAWVRFGMPCSHYQEPLVGSASRPNSMPMQQVCGKASGWLPGL